MLRSHMIDDTFITRYVITLYKQLQYTKLKIIELFSSDEDSCKVRPFNDRSLIYTNFSLSAQHLHESLNHFNQFTNVKIL